MLIKYLLLWKFIFCHMFMDAWFLLSQPYFEKVWGWNSHSWNGDLTSKTSEFNCRGQNTLHWDVLYIIEKLSKCRCRKWAHMSHLDICSTSYGKKKRRESNWQFDSQPLKVENWPNLNGCRWSATHRWKAFKESYKLALDLIQSEVWAKNHDLAKSWESKLGQFQDLSLRVLGQKAIWM
jgi:hypothetical protein